MYLAVTTSTAAPVQESNENAYSLMRQKSNIRAQ